MGSVRTPHLDISSGAGATPSCVQEDEVAGGEAGVIAQ